MNTHTETLVVYTLDKPELEATWKVHTMDEDNSGAKIMVPTDVVSVNGHNMDVSALLRVIGVFLQNKTA